MSPPPCNSSNMFFSTINRPMKVSTRKSQHFFGTVCVFFLLFNGVSIVPTIVATREMRSYFRGVHCGSARCVLRRSTWLDKHLIFPRPYARWRWGELGNDNIRLMCLSKHTQGGWVEQVDCQFWCTLGKTRQHVVNGCPKWGRTVSFFQAILGVAPVHTPHFHRIGASI